MAEIDDLPNEILEMILCHVVAGAKMKYSELDNLMKVSQSWSDIIYNATIPMKKSLTMLVDDLWEPESLRDESTLMQKYKQFHTTQHLCLQDYMYERYLVYGEPEWDTKEEYFRFFMQATECIITFNYWMFDELVDQTDLLIQRLRKHIKITVKTVSPSDLSQLQYLISLKVHKLKFILDEELLCKMTMWKTRQAQLPLSKRHYFQAETVELKNSCNYPNLQKTYSFPKSSTRDDEIFDLCESTFKKVFVD